jgi:BlaI family transcriptional regulator, penicillinase repressor
MASERRLPSGAELEILRVLWAKGPSTVREVHDALDADTSYTTTLKLLQKMYAKGLVRRDATARSHVFEPTIDQESTLTALVRRVTDRLFEGSGAALALRALGDRPVTRDELAALKRLIREKESAQK